MTYNSNLKEIIKSKFGTYKVAADLLGISKSYWGDVLGGRAKVSVQQLERFEKVLGLKITVSVSVEDLKQEIK